jgi:phosphotriesterase-related protein
MTRVNTVLGPIAVEQLGFTSIHEHIGYGMPGSELDTRWWKTPEQRYEETIPKLRKFAEYGGQTFVDATGICNGRDIDYYQSISEKTGVNIIAATGFVGGDTALKHFAEASVEYLADQFIHELTVGISRTGGKAGIIKVGVSRGFKMTALDLRIYRAAARASLATGAPIITHLAVDAQSAIDVFDEEGLPLTRVLFGHADDGVSQGKVDEEGIVGAGGRIGFDTFGYDLELPDRRSGAATATSASSTSCATCAQGRSTRCSSPPTPTAARWAGRASRGTRSTTCSSSSSPTSRPTASRMPSSTSSSSATSPTSSLRPHPSKASEPWISTD